MAKALLSLSGEMLVTIVAARLAFIATTENGSERANEPCIGEERAAGLKRDGDEPGRGDGGGGGFDHDTEFDVGVECDFVLLQIGFALLEYFFCGVDFGEV